MNSLHPVVKRYHSDSFGCERKALICVICGACARGYNFGAITCMSCKIFFRRNALTNFDRFSCQQGGNCEINEQTRRHCTYCRLVMCFRVGMKKELIRKSRDTTDFKRKHFDYHHHHHEEFHANINEKDDYWRTSNPVKVTQWCYTSSSTMNSTTSTVNNQDWSIFTRLSLLFDSLSYQIAHKACETYQCLSSMSMQPLKIRMKASYIYDMNDMMTLAGLKFFKSIPQISFLSENLQRILYIRHARIFLMYFTHYQMNLDSISTLTQMPCWISSFDCLLSRSTNRLFDEINCQVARIHSVDPYLTQLILFLLAFTCTSIDLDDHQTSDEYRSSLIIFKIQNIYIDLLWNYMIHRLGETHTMTLYPSIINTILRIQQFLFIIEQSERNSERKFDENLKTFIERTAQCHS